MQQSLIRLRYRLSHSGGDDMLSLVNNLLATLKDEPDSAFGLRIFSQLSASWNFTSITYADSASFYTPQSDDGEDSNEPLSPPPEMDESERQKSLEDFYDNIESGYDDSVVMNAFKAGKKEVRASELEINTVEEYSALLYAAVRGLDDDAPYESIWDDAFEEIEKNGFTVTNYRFRLREKSEK